jgi:hypothetical protein
MARIYSRTNAVAVDAPEFGHFERQDHGGFDLPDELSDRLLAVHYRGKPAWEDQAGRDDRLHGEETDRQRDPKTLYNAVADIASLGKQLAALGLGSEPESNAELAALREQVAAMEARFAAMDEHAEPSGGAAPDSDAAPAKSARSGKSTRAGS